MISNNIRAHGKIMSNWELNKAIFEGFMQTYSYFRWVKMKVC